jgi:hypothetical protein
MSDNQNQFNIIQNSMMYQLTINNPAPEDFISSADKIHDRIVDILTKNFNTMYFCYCIEKAPTTDTTHLHLFIHFGIPTDCFDKLKKYFPTSHIEKCHGSLEQNVDYIKKHTNKTYINNETLENGEITEGAFYEHGVKPPVQNHYKSYSNDILIEAVTKIELKIDELLKIISINKTTKC